MRLDSVLISCFLLASAVLAGPRQSQQLNILERSSSPDAVNSSNWAGAAMVRDNHITYFNNVNGTFTAPQLSGEPGSAIAVWVGIDNDNNGCPDSLSAGIISTVTKDGTQHQPFMLWKPYPPKDLNITVSTGDLIQVTLETSDPMSGSLSFDNLSSGQSNTKGFRTSSSLCGRDAEWIVGVVSVDGTTVPLANFGTVSITDGGAGTTGGPSYGLPHGATLHQMMISYQDQGGHVTQNPVASAMWLNGSLIVTHV